MYYGLSYPAMALYDVGMAVLGDLETAVMQILWSQPEPMSVRGVHARVGLERDLAYTTVMTVLDRLAKKGIVVRELEGRAWLYSASVTHVDLVVAEVAELLTHLSSSERAEAVAGIVREAQTSADS